MKGATRILPSQPLLPSAPKTASGGKIRARRFAPAWSADKPLYRFGKTRRRAQSRVGAPILGQTVGGVLADRMAGNRRSRATDRPSDTSAPASVRYDGPLVPDRPVEVADFLPDLSGAGTLASKTGSSSAYANCSNAAVLVEPAPDNYDPRFASNWTGDLIVVGRRPSPRVSVASAASSRHGLGWRIADALGFHPGGLFYEAFARKPDPDPDPASIYGHSYNYSSKSNIENIWDNNFRDLPRNMINGFAAQMNSTSTVLLAPYQARAGDYLKMGLLAGNVALTTFPGGPAVGARLSSIEARLNVGAGRWAAERGTVTLYRVDDAAFAPRIAADGSVPVVTTRSGGERALFVNIGQPERAAEFALVNRGGNATVTAVEVDASFLERMRATSVLDTGPAARLNPSAPLRVDVNKAPDQFGLRTPDQIQMLRDAMRPGTARVVDPRTLRR